MEIEIRVLVRKLVKLNMLKVTGNVSIPETDEMGGIREIVVKFLNVTKNK